MKRFLHLSILLAVLAFPVGGWGQYTYNDYGYGTYITGYTSPTPPLRTLVMPEKLGGSIVKGIWSDVFRGLDELTSVSLPLRVTTIESRAFSGCKSLNYVHFGYELRTIGADAFSFCPNLPRVWIIPSVSSIGPGAFAGCSAMTEINVDTRNSEYSSLGGVLYNKSGTTLVTYPGGLHGGYEIPAGVTTIGDYSFSFCTNLSNLTMPNSVISIGSRAFWGCTNLTSISLSDNLTSIGSAAFFRCTGLSSVNLPSSVTNIKLYAFAACSSLTNVVIPARVTRIEVDTFEGCTNLTSVYFYGPPPVFERPDQFSGSPSIVVYYVPGIAGWNSSFPFRVEPNPAYHRLDINGGSGVGYYTNNQVVPVSAVVSNGFYFAGWSGDTQYLACVTAATTTVLMPATNVLVSAIYRVNPTLCVASAYSLPVPYVGSQMRQFGSPLACAVPSPDPHGSTQYVCTGWSMSGNEPTFGSSTNLTMILTNDATLTWQWQTQYLLREIVCGPGSVTQGGWFVSGSNAVLAATVGMGINFSGWFGETNGCVIDGYTITVPMTQARSITAFFTVITQTLQVVSMYGGTLTGSVATNWGSPVQLLVHSPVITGTTQHVCTGATVFGNDYIQVSPTNVTLTLTNDATLTWQWTTNYWLAIGTNGYGAVSLASGWKGVGSNVSVIASPSANAHFVKWSGNTNGCLVTSNQLVAVMNQARTITAVFAAGSLPVIMGAVTRSDNSKAGLAGVTIAFSGGAGSTVTDGAGCYSNIVPYGWSGTVTATYTNGGFVKSNLTFKTVTKSKTKQNFVWSPDPVISGTVTTPDKKVATNVTLSASNGGGITITGSNGSYRLTVPYNWTGILAPAGGTSKPVGKSFRHLKRNVANVKFVFTPTQAPSAAPNVEQGLRIVDIRLPVDPLTPICAVYGFPQWLIDHGLTGDPSVLFDQDADGDGISNGAEYTFGANLLEWESLVRLLTNNARLTAEVPVQDPATLLDARETVEFTTDPYSGFWFPAVCLPPNGQIPFNKQWYQDFNGQAVKFRVRVERVP